MRLSFTSDVPLCFCPVSEIEGHGRLLVSSILFPIMGWKSLIGVTVCVQSKHFQKREIKKRKGKGREIMLLSFAIKINFDSSVSVTLLSVDGRVPLRKCSYLGKFRVFWASLLGEAPARLLQI